MPPRDDQGFFRRNILTILTCASVVSGTIVGAILKDFKSDWTAREIMYINFPGEIFLNMLKALIIPLLVASITSAIGSLDLRMSGKIARRAILYYMTTTITAVMLGIILVLVLQPGRRETAQQASKPIEKQTTLTVDTILDLIRNLFPPNLIEATVATPRTVLEIPKNQTFLRTFVNNTPPLEAWDFKLLPNPTTNVLGLVMFSVILGTAIGRLQPLSEPLQSLFHALSETMMIVTNWVIWISPLGVFFLVVSKIVEMESIAETVTKLGWYFFTVLLGLGIHGFGTIPLIYFVCVHRLPYKYIAKMGYNMATAFGTGSSSATMPITIQTLDEIGVDPRVTRFVIPIGATINMDGTALYEAVAAIFISQLRNMHLSLGQVIAVSITATAASIGAAGIPQAGLVTMVMVLDTVGLPSEDVSIILAVDWLLDRFRTTINVMCDSVGALLVEHMSENDLKSRENNELGEPHELMELKSGVEK